MRLLIYRGEIAVGLGILLGVLLSAINQWGLASYFSKIEFGKLASAWAIAQIVLQLNIYGTHHFLLNRAANGGFRNWFPHVFYFVTRNCAVTTIFILLLGWLLLPEWKEIFFWLALWVVFSIPILLIYVVFQNQSRTTWVALWPLCQIGARSVFILIAVLYSLSIVDVAIGYAISALLLSIVGMLVLKRYGFYLNWQRVSFSAVKSKYICRYSFPYLGYELIEKLDLKLSIPLCLILIGPEAAGSMAVATGILLAVLVIPQGLAQRYFLAQMHEWSSNDEGRLSSFLLKVSSNAFIISSVVAVAMYFWVGELVAFLFGDKYIETTGVIEVLVIIVPILIVSNLLANRFLSVIKIKQLLQIQLLFIGSYLVVALIMIINFGLIGACIAILFSRLAYLLTLLIMMYRSNDFAGLK